MRHEAVQVYEDDSMLGYFRTMEDSQFTPFELVCRFRRLMRQLLHRITMSKDLQARLQYLHWFLSDLNRGRFLAAGTILHNEDYLQRLPRHGTDTGKGHTSRNCGGREEETDEGIVGREEHTLAIQEDSPEGASEECFAGLDFPLDAARYKFRQVNPVGPVRYEEGILLAMQVLCCRFGFSLVEKYSEYALTIEHLVIDREEHWHYDCASLPEEEFRVPEGNSRS